MVLPSMLTKNISQEIRPVPALRTLFLLALLCFTLFFVPMAGGTLSASPFVLFPGPPTAPLAGEDLLLHRMNDEFYAESWYLQAQFTDGTLLFLHYGVSNAGLGNFNGAVEHTAILPDGQVVFDKLQFSPKEIRYAPERLKIHFGDAIVLEGDLNRYHLKSTKGKFRYELTVIPEVPGLKFGKGKTLFPREKQFYALAILTPRGKVEGNLTLEGNKPAPVQGTGYMDHAWQNYPAHRMANRLYSLRGFEPGGEGITFLTFFYPSGGEIPTLVLHRGGEVAYATSSLTTRGEGEVKDPVKPHYSLPLTLMVETRDGVQGKITLKEQLMRQDAVQDFNLFERTLIKMFVADPVLYRYRSHYRFEKGELRWEGEGVVEIVVLRE